MGDSYYSEYRGKKQKHRRHRSGCGGMLISALFRMILTVLILAIAALGILYVLPVSIMNLIPADQELSVTKGLDAERMNVLLLGLDIEKDGQQRCDGIMVATIGKNQLKITSLQRDTEVNIPGYSGIHKLNAAYSYGGPELTIRVVNETFGLNITDYVAVSFETLVNVVDAIGGIDMTIDENELPWYNKKLYDTYRALCKIDSAKYSGYLTPADELKEPGEIHMDGLHTMTYCRLRYSDSDYGRTYRQRKVITAMLAKVKEKVYDPMMYAKMAKWIFGSLKTSMSLPALMSVGLKVLGAGVGSSVETYRVPQNEYIKDNGSTIEITDLGQVRAGLHSFIYT